MKSQTSLTFATDSIVVLTAVWKALFVALRSAASGSGCSVVVLLSCCVRLSACLSLVSVSFLLFHCYYYYFASAAVAVDYSHMTASSSTSWSRFGPPIPTHLGSCDCCKLLNARMPFIAHVTLLTRRAAQLKGSAVAFSIFCLFCYDRTVLRIVAVTCHTIRYEMLFSRAVESWHESA